jgi:hypothetical protein
MVSGAGSRSAQAGSTITWQVPQLAEPPQSARMPGTPKPVAAAIRLTPSGASKPVSVPSAAMKVMSGMGCTAQKWPGRHHAGSARGENSAMDLLDVDTVIVGAGIAGASLAWQLVQADAAQRVLLLERESQPGMHSTGRSAAMWMPSYGPPAVRALTRAAGAFYAAPPAGFTDVPLLPPRGVLYVAAPGQQAGLDALENELTLWCSGMQRLDVAATLARAPWLRAEQLIGSLWDPESTDIDVHALHQGYLRGFRRAGGQVRCDAELVAAAT